MSAAGAASQSLPVPIPPPGPVLSSSSILSTITQSGVLSNTPFSISSLSISLNYIITGYWQEYGDPRLSKSPFFGGGPWQMFAFVAIYLMAVTSIGPRLMRHRKPMQNLIWPIRFYNTFMVAFNTYLFVGFSRRLNLGLDCWGCGAESVSTRLVPTQDLYLWELTLLSRYFDFLDSIFFVCRKKFDHLTLLHIGHHSVVPIIIWFAGKFAATPQVVFAGYLNLLVHVIMYTYYGLSTYPPLKKYLWWKKYLTSVQIVQFLVDFVHSIQAIFTPGCKHATITYVQFVTSLMFMYLFGQFYLRSYIKNAQRKQTSKQSETNDNKSNNSNGNQRFVATKSITDERPRRTNGNADDANVVKSSSASSSKLSTKLD